MKKKVYLKLEGMDGNAFYILGAFRNAAKKQGFDNEWIENVLTEAKSGDYNHLLAIILDNTTSEKSDLLEIAPDYNDICEESGGLYWAGEGRFQILQDKYWDELVPAKGEAPTLHGEILRSINRFYYDVYNNGLGNNMEDFAQTILDNWNKFSQYDDLSLLSIAKKKLENYVKNKIEQNEFEKSWRSWTEEEFDYVDFSKPFTWSKSLDSLVDAILQYVDSIVTKKIG